MIIFSTAKFLLYIEKIYKYTLKSTNWLDNAKNCIQTKKSLMRKKNSCSFEAPVTRKELFTRKTLSKNN